VTRPLPGPDTQPWYRQFWPWFLIALPGCVVVAALSTAYVASRHADDLVTDDYYQDGLAINRQLEKLQRATAMGISARLRFSGDTVSVDVTGPVTDSALRLLLSHPIEADRDFSATLARVGPGLYRAVLPGEVAPHWHWTLQALRDNDWRVDGVVHAGDIQDAGGR